MTLPEENNANGHGKSMPDELKTRRPREEPVAEQAADAHTDEVPRSRLGTDSLDRQITALRSDKDFQKRLTRRLEEDREVLERLAR